jgi:hypothetical protein
MKRFVSLQFLHIKTLGRTAWRGDQPVAIPLPITNTEYTKKIHVLSGIRTHNPCVGAGENISCIDLAATVMCSYFDQYCGNSLKERSKKPSLNGKRG